MIIFTYNLILSICCDMADILEIPYSLHHQAKSQSSSMTDSSSNEESSDNPILVGILFIRIIFTASLLYPHHRVFDEKFDSLFSPFLELDIPIAIMYHDPKRSTTSSASAFTKHSKLLIPEPNSISNSTILNGGNTCKTRACLSVRYSLKV